MLTLLKSDTGVISDEMEPVPISQKESIWLRAEISADGMSVVFRYSLNGTDWQQAGKEQTTQILTDEHCKGFTGAYFGIYCHDMTGLAKTADFEYLTVTDPASGIPADK